ncbi:glycerol-3-phosphate dehydrogenase [Roseicella frigidaeris]|uniref:glycerol-3-phosphate dehydrogenase n=1 Tax=Roseicella frigidaeris TaxID=2230885 RepID=UPI0038D082E3
MAIAGNSQVQDLLVVGGGVNGCGIARDAAGRGLAVTLVEKGDLAGATSSASTKLIHGGLRYLEHREFRLVREALIEREVLLRAAPHIIWPLRFVLPHHKGLRPWPVLRLGLFLYDHLGGRRILPPTRSLDLRRDPAGAPLQPHYRRGFEYSDCWVEDARLVVLNARDAADHGAAVLTRMRCLAARREDGLWRATLRDEASGATREVAARAMVNAAGPWVAEMLGAAGQNAPARVRLVKGSHIVTRRLWSHDRSYIFQNADGRVCFAIPYEEDFTLIGTTDEEFAGDPAGVAITEGETAYLCRAVSDYVRQPVTPADVVWSYAGVRPLYDDGASRAQEATRDYVLTLDAPAGQAPLLSVFGGKITTYRRLAEAAMARLAPHFPGLPGAWTAGARLPGGDFPWDGAPRLVAELRARYPFLDPALARRLVRQYGTRAGAVLGDADGMAALGEAFGAGLTAREVEWQRREEWVRSAEDLLWRRSKLGLRIDAAGRAALQRHLAGAMPAAGRAAE